MRTALSLPTLLLTTLTAAAGLHLATQEQTRQTPPALSLPTYSRTTSAQQPADVPLPRDANGVAAPSSERPEIDVLTHEDREPLLSPPLMLVAEEEPIVGC